MLDLFSIFSKGGIVLWCFQSTSQIFSQPVNALISNLILQERGGNNSFEHNTLLLKYKLDNEFELVFVVAYQKVLQLSYVDKFLDDVHLEFRDKYKNVLEGSQYYEYDFDFGKNFKAVLKNAEEWEKLQLNVVKPMRTFNESEKSKKTVASMIIKRPSDNKENKKKEKINQVSVKKEPLKVTNGETNPAEDVILQNRMKLAQKLGSKGNAKKKTSKKIIGETIKEKKPRDWGIYGNNTDTSQLDYTKDPDISNGYVPNNVLNNASIVGQMVGKVRDLEVSSDESAEDSDTDEEFETAAQKRERAGNKSRSMFSLFKGLVGNKSITVEMINPVLEKLKEHLIAKNVATDISQKLCDSVSSKLEGKVIGTFETVTSTVKTTMIEALTQILSPKRRVDILRDVLQAKSEGRPFVMVFCGVNGVGKSTNLAKICFWLIENNLRVLIAACDTFRAGAVEQLRTHTRHLNSLHPPDKHNNLQMVQLYEKGYGKDAAGIAKEAINFADDSGIDVVLVDTAGRMQDNEPLMRALSKLINVNEPDLVLFVGEALVGNEAVDQLVKFNQAMADYSLSSIPHVIDGIVLTKFDTIDDKVGAAISMTYITGQPIVFVGTGQTYTDLKSLNVNAVVSALMK